MSDVGPQWKQKQELWGSSSYLQALEMRLGWLRWLEESPVAAEINEALMLEVAGYSLMTSGATYFMSKPFCDLVEHLRKTVPDDLQFDMKWLQTSEGFVWFGSPFTAAAIDDDPGNLMRAMSWCKASNRTDLPSAVQIIFYVDLADLKGVRNPQAQYGFMTNGSFLVKEGCLLREGVAEMVKQMPQYQGTMLRQTMLYLAFAALYLMGQRLAIKSEVKADRATRRRMEHNGKQSPLLPVVQVITLRRLEPQGIRPKPGDDHEVDWHWQWVVGKHWRRQYFPSLGQHKYIVIDSYMKGPEDKPVKPPSSRIYVARR